MMVVARADRTEAEEILALQKLASQSEAAICGDYEIPPLTQTREEIEGEFEGQDLSQGDPRRADHRLGQGLRRGWDLLHREALRPSRASEQGPGHAAGCLAGHRYFSGDEVALRVEQGYEMGRPSLLFLRAGKKQGEEISVSVGGRVIMIARGEFI